MMTGLSEGEGNIAAVDDAGPRVPPALTRMAAVDGGSDEVQVTPDIVQQSASRV